MLPKPEPAYFAIADISGYTNFLAGVELDHAQDIIADLMDTVVKGLRPPFRLAKFEGDAAFVYAATEKVDARCCRVQLDFGLFQIPPARARHQAGLGLRMQSLRRDGRSRFQVCRPSRRDGEAEDGRARRACRTRCDPRPPAPQEHSERKGRQPRLRAVQRRLYRDDGHRPGGAGTYRASRDNRHHRRCEKSGCAIWKRRGITKTRPRASRSPARKPT